MNPKDIMLSENKSDTKGQSPCGSIYVSCEGRGGAGEAVAQSAKVTKAWRWQCGGPGAAFLPKTKKQSYAWNPTLFLFSLWGEAAPHTVAGTAPES